jgi:4-amino-4-deoxy-L-arabinose transferase-like glycosyltransferase
MSWWNSPKTFPVRIFLIALILRLAPVLALRNMGIGLDDMFQYDMLARSIVSGDGYRWYAEKDLPIVLPYLQLDLASIDYDPRGVLTSFRPPLYPTFLALIYFVFGVGTHRFFIARLVQTVLAASMAPLTYALARHLFPNRERESQTSSWIISLYPILVIYPLSLATENLFFVLVLCSLLALFKGKKSLEIPFEKEENFSSFVFRSRYFIIAGILLGLTCLTRSVAQIFVVLAVAWVFIFLKERKRALIMLILVVVVIAPWVVRNSILYGRLTGIESAIGYDLYLGYHPMGTGA